MACVAPSGAAARIAGSRAAHQEGDALADRLLGVNGYTAAPRRPAAPRRRQRVLLTVFTVQLLQRLRLFGALKRQGLQVRARRLGTGVRDRPPGS